LDRLSTYVNNLDYSTNGIVSGKLKVSFEAAFNVLDKIAFFLNDYCRLGIAENQINFSRIWKENDRLRPELSKYQNIHLYGLYNLSSDFFRGFKHYRELRHRSTHRYIVAHVEGFGWRDDLDDMSYHVGLRQLYDDTVELLQIVRAAVIYLVAFIGSEEQNKLRELKNPVFSSEVPTWRFAPPDPRDSPI
jgi:hypothetical protein